MIKPWVFEFFHSIPARETDDPGAVKQQHDRHLALWQKDENLDFEGIFFSEHHFGPGYSPNPNLLVAALALTTKRMRLGTLGCSTAYVDALRIVEEAAMLDNLTNGRLEFGIVRGIPQELERLGMTVPDGEARFEGILKDVDAAFRAANGAFICRGLPVAPPLRQSDMPKWLAITSERSARRAAKIGWKICAGFVSTGNLTALFDAYRDEAGLTRAQAFDLLGVRRRILFVDDASAAPMARVDLRKQAIAHAKAGMKGVSQAPGSAQAIIDLDAMIQKLLSEDEFIVGTPGDVAEQIIDQCRTAGCAHFMAGMDSTDIFEDMAKAHEIFGEKVIPLLRKADVTLSTEMGV